MHDSGTDRRQEPGSGLEWYVDMVFDDPSESCEKTADMMPDACETIPEVPPHSCEPEPEQTATECRGTSIVTEEPARTGPAPPLRTPRSPAPAWQKQDDTSRRPRRTIREKRSAVRPSVAKQKITTGANTAGVRQKVMMVLIPILATTLFILLRHPVGESGGTKADHIDPDSSGESASTNVEIDWRIPPVYDTSLRDPMQLTQLRANVRSEPTEVEEVLPHVELAVTGILYSDEEPTAIVNTQVVREGQAISGVTVVEIDRDGVEFEMNGRRWRQTVYNQD